MKMLISPTPIARQSSHSHIFHKVSAGNGRWLSGNHPVLNNKANSNGINHSSVDIKPYGNYRSYFFGNNIPINKPSTRFSPSPDLTKILPTDCVSSKETVLNLEISSSPKPGSNSALRRQESLEFRANRSLKRLRFLKNKASKRILFGEVRCAVLQMVQDMGSNVVKYSLASKSTNDALKQLAYDTRKLLADFPDEDATDMEEDYDESYFYYREAHPLTGNVSHLPASKNVLEATPAWRFEQERLSLIAREAYLCLKISELDAKRYQLHEHVPTKIPRTSSQSDKYGSDTSMDHKCSSARTRHYSTRRMHTFYRISSPRNNSETWDQATTMSCFHGLSTLTSAGCHCSCRFAGSSASPMYSRCQLNTCSSGTRNISASQPNLDAERRLSMLDPAFHPKLSKLNGCDVLSSTRSFDRLDTAAACLLDHAYSAEPIMTNVKVSQDCTTNCSTSSQNFSLPPVPLPQPDKMERCMVDGVLRNWTNVESSIYDLALNKKSQTHDKRKKLRKQLRCELQFDIYLFSKVLEKKRRLEQRKRLQLQRRKEHQRRKQKHKNAKKQLVMQRSSPQNVLTVKVSSNNQCGSLLSSSLSNSSTINVSGPCLLSASTPSGSNQALGSGGFDIDNVVIPPPTPTALMAAAQVFAESTSVEIATPGFRKLVIEPIKTVGRSRQSKYSSVVSKDKTSSSSDQIEDISLHSSAFEVFSEKPGLSRVFEETDELAYRRRHIPFEQQERARYLAIMQHTIAPRKVRDLAVGARPPNQQNLHFKEKGKGKSLSRSCTDERPRRSSRVSAATSCLATTDPECKPFVFPLSEAEWKNICAEKEAFSCRKRD